MITLALFVVLTAPQDKASTVQSLPIQVEADRAPIVKTGGNCLIRGGKVFTVTGATYDKADILVQNGKIVQIAPSINPPPGITVIDAQGKCVLPGFVDAHSHRGEDESNEWSATAVPEVKIHDILNAEQEGLWYDLANGITTGMLLHGSSNAIGGQSVVVKHRYKKRAGDLIFQGAPRMIKFALGENVSEKLNPTGTRFPQTRAGVESVYRRAFADARAYMAAKNPRPDVRLEALADILRGKIWVQCHSYRQDEMLMMVRLSQEFGFKIGSMQHALEGYKIAPEMAAAGVPASMFSDAWAYKVEVQDAIPMGASLCVRAGVLSSINTDSFGGLSPLNIDAAKQMRYGISEADALKLITINPAKQLGVERWVGSLEVGKDADIAIWAGHPLSVFSKCETTLLDGEVVFNRRDMFKIDAQSMVESTVKPSRLVSDLAAELPVAPAYAIVGATIHPISRLAITDGVVVVRGDKITAVGGRETPIPGNAYRLNAKGLDVYPGFFDAGSDMGLNEIGSVTSMQDDGENGPFQPDLKFLTSVQPESNRFGIARCGGVTSGLIRPSGRGIIAGQGAVISLEGSTSEQMAVAGPGTMHIYFPEGVSPQIRSFLPPDAIEKAEKSVSVNRDALDDYFNRARRYQIAKAAGQVKPDAQLDSLIPCFEGKRPVVIHANAEESIREALKWAKAQGLRMILAGAAESWKTIPELKAQGVPVLYNAPSSSALGANQPQSEFDPYDSSLVAPALLIRAGIKVALQTGGSSQIMNLPFAAGMTCAFGNSPDAALRMITLAPAEIFGVADRLGSLDVGKNATLIITEGNPLEITTQLRYEFINGKPMRLTSHFTELYRKYEKRLPKGK